MFRKKSVQSLKQTFEIKPSFFNSLRNVLFFLFTIYILEAIYDGHLIESNFKLKKANENFCC